MRNILRNRSTRRLLLMFLAVSLLASAGAAATVPDFDVLLAVALGLLGAVSLAAFKAAIEAHLDIERNIDRRLRQLDEVTHRQEAEHRLWMASLEEHQHGAEEELQELAARVDRVHEDVRERAAHLLERLEGRATELAERADRLELKTDELNGVLLRLSGRTKELHDAFEQQRERQAELATSISSLEEARSTAKVGLQVLTGEVAQSREMSEELVDRLITTWQEPLRLPLDPRMLRYLTRKLYAVESRCRGRLATAIEDAIVRALVTSSVQASKARVLEVGVLFAVNAGYLWEVASPYFASFHQTLVDPFEGYYGQNEPDPITRVPVTKAVAADNLRRLGVPSHTLTWVPGFSTDADVLSRTTDRTYEVVLLDGDHSYEGVRSDYEHYAPTVAPGGFLIMDDYGVNEWPGVTRLVDEQLMNDDRFELVATATRTAVFRRV